MDPKIKAIQQKGLKFLKANEFKKAADEFVYVTMKDAGNLQAHLLLIKCYLELEDLNMAEITLNKMLDNHADDPSVKNCAYNVYKKTNIYEAIPMLLEITRELLETESATQDRKIRQIKELFDFIKNLEQNYYKEFDKSVIISLSKQITKYLKDVQDKEMLRNLSGFLSLVSEKIIVHDVAVLNDCLAMILPYISDIKMRDSILFDIIKDKELLNKTSEVLDVLLNLFDDEGMSDSEMLHFLILKYGFFFDLSDSEFSKYLNQYFSWKTEKELISLFAGKKFGVEFGDLIKKWVYILTVSDGYALSEKKFEALENFKKDHFPTINRKNVVLPQNANKDLVDYIVDIAESLNSNIELQKLENLTRILLNYFEQNQNVYNYSGLKVYFILCLTDNFVTHDEKLRMNKLYYFDHFTKWFDSKHNFNTDLKLAIFYFYHNYIENTYSGLSIKKTKYLINVNTCQDRISKSIKGVCDFYEEYLTLDLCSMWLDLNFGIEDDQNLTQCVGFYRQIEMPDFVNEFNYKEKRLMGNNMKFVFASRLQLLESAKSSESQLDQNLDISKKQLMLIVKSQGNNSLVFNNLGTLSVACKKNNDARLFLENSIEIKQPNFLETHYSYLISIQNKPEDQLQYLISLKRTYKNETWLNLSLGLAYANNNKWAEAYELLSVSLSTLNTANNSKEKNKFTTTGNINQTTGMLSENELLNLQNPDIITKKQKVNKYLSAQSFCYNSKKDKFYYTSTLLLSDNFLREKGQVFMCEKLDIIEKEYLISLLTFLVSVSNKFIIKPQAALKGFNDLEAIFNNKKVKIDSENSQKIFDERMTGNANLKKIYDNLSIVVKKFFYVPKSLEITYFNDERYNVLNLVTLGELSLLNSFIKETKTSLLYLLNYLSNCHDFNFFSVSTFLESLSNNIKSSDYKNTKNYVQFCNAVSNICETCFSILEQSLTSVDNNGVEHGIFQIFYLLFLVDDESMIVDLMNRINNIKLVKKNPHVNPQDFKNTDQKFNASLIYPSMDKLHLIKNYSNNSVSWLALSLKSPSKDHKLKLASAQLSLNLNYENQIIWNYISNILYDTNKKALAYQCINMAKVFSSNDEVGSIKHAINIWYKIMLDVSTFKQPEKDSIIDNIVQNIRGIGITNNLYVEFIENSLSDIKREVYEKSLKPQKNTSDEMNDLQLKISVLVFSENPQVKVQPLIKSANLYLLLAISNKAYNEKEFMLDKIIGSLKNFAVQKSFSEFRKKYYETANSGYTNENIGNTFNKLIIEGLKLLIEIFVKFLQNPKNAKDTDYLYIENLYKTNIIGTFCCFCNKKTPEYGTALNTLFNFSEPGAEKTRVEKLSEYYLEQPESNSMFQMINNFYSSKLSNPSENIVKTSPLKKLEESKLDLLSDPTNMINRNAYLINLTSCKKQNNMTIQINKKNTMAKAKVNYKDAQFENSFLNFLANIIGSSSQFKEKFNKLKLRLLSNPLCKFTRSLFTIQEKHLSNTDQNSSTQKVQETLQQKFKDYNDLFNKYIQSKKSIIETHFSQIPNCSHLSSGYYIWKNLSQIKFNNNQISINAEICKISALDAILLDIITTINKLVDNEQFQKYEGIFAENVVNNSLFDPTYLVAYIQYLFRIGDFESLEDWINLASMIKMPEKIEFIVNYYVLQKNLKDAQESPDDEELSEVLTELYTYFETECKFKDISHLVALTKDIKTFINKDDKKYAESAAVKLKNLYTVKE